MSLHETELIVSEFLGEHPRAEEWRALRQALAGRLSGLRQQRREGADAGLDAPALRGLDTQIAAIERQVATLETEEAVAQFVEDSVRATLAKSMPGDGDDDAEAAA